MICNCPSRSDTAIAHDIRCSISIMRAQQNQQSEETLRQHQKETLIDFGMTNSSKKPRYALIPPEALEALAARFELGEEKHTGKTWNAMTDQAALDNKDWIISRAEHAIHHALKFIKTYINQEPYTDDDAAAIMWAGTLLYMAMKRKKDNERTKCS